ncbi:CHY zinc finger domain-containing protein [Spironucleus salmonicida]|uniref:CHY zinc finger domain-containing protein n=1 Tax=Spironucleus salmonicida TaxID=348837 RepID=V6LQS1_9EUKA|nr:CHY zinc finger domain-containing protein [Spironucleus salmonicida]|eukprot:EST46930.1 CHY zinc finger domain-containing protein [Spironucleus salmonicida]
MNLIVDKIDENSRQVLVQTRTYADRTQDHFIQSIITEEKQFLLKNVNKVINKQTHIESYSVQYALACDHEVSGAFYVCKVCKNLTSCRRCHNETYDHKFEYFQIACKFCAKTQQMGKICINCDQVLASQICQFCPLLTSIEPVIKPLFHCISCNTCRIGKKNDFQHCNNCDKCIKKSNFATHNCVKISGNCPICLDEMSQNCQILHCGHQIHVFCFKNYGKLTCPICLKIGICGERREKWKLKQIRKRQFFMFKMQNCKALCRECEREFYGVFSSNCGVWCANCQCFNCQVVGDAKDGEAIEGGDFRSVSLDSVNTFIDRNFTPKESYKMIEMNNFRNEAELLEMAQFLNEYMIILMNQGKAIK